jgi:hypothetical protein
MRRKIDDQRDDRLACKLATANTEPANFDEARKFARRPHHELTPARLQVDPIVPDQNRRRYLPGAPRNNEIECQT